MSEEQLLNLSAVSYIVTSLNQTTMLTNQELGQAFMYATDDNFTSINVIDSINSQSGVDGYFLKVEDLDNTYECFVFTGSQIGDKDWLHNTTNAAYNIVQSNQITKQTTDVQAFIDNNPPTSDKVYVTGHSNGGGHSLDASVRLIQNNSELNVKTTTINSAPASYASMRYYETLNSQNLEIKNFYTQKDILKATLNKANLAVFGTNILIQQDIGHIYYQFNNAKVSSKIEFESGLPKNCLELTTVSQNIRHKGLNIRHKLNESQILINADNLTQIVNKLRSYDFNLLFSIFTRLDDSYPKLKLIAFDQFMNALIENKFSDEQVIMWQNQIINGSSEVDLSIFINAKPVLLKLMYYSYQILDVFKTYVISLQYLLNYCSNQIEQIVTFFVQLDLNLYDYLLGIIVDLKSPKLSSPNINLAQMFMQDFNLDSSPDLELVVVLNSFILSDENIADLNSSLILLSDLSNLINSSIVEIQNNADANCIDGVIQMLRNLNNIRLNHFYEQNLGFITCLHELTKK